MHTDNPKPSCRKRGGIILAVGIAICTVTNLAPLGEKAGVLGTVLFSAGIIVGSIESMTGCPFWQLGKKWPGLKAWQKLVLFVILAPLGLLLVISTVFLLYFLLSWKSIVVTD